MKPNQNIPATGETRLNSSPINPTALVLLEAVRRDLASVRRYLPAGSLLWFLTGTALHTVNLILRKIQQDRISHELDGQAYTPHISFAVHSNTLTQGE